MKLLKLILCLGLLAAQTRAYYNPATGRWLSRDPLQERGGANLYGMVGNDAVNDIDPFGLTRYFYGHELIDEGTEPFHAEIPSFLADKLGGKASFSGTLYWKKVVCGCNGSTKENQGKTRYIATLERFGFAASGAVSLKKPIVRMAPAKYQKQVERVLDLAGVNVDLKLSGSGTLKLHYDQCRETGSGGGPISVSASTPVSSQLGAESVFSVKTEGAITVAGAFQVAHQKGIFTVAPSPFSGTASLRQEEYMAGEQLWRGAKSWDLFTTSGSEWSLRINARDWPWTFDVR